MTRAQPSRIRATEARYLRMAALATVLIAATVFLSFGGGVPLIGKERAEIHAVFSTANQLRAGNPVRLAGIDIGEVTAIERGPGASSIVSMRIDDLDELHADASMKIQPRLLFEGNFSIKVNPGSPGAGRLRDGATIPRSRTAVPVQLDQVLNVFERPVRESFKNAVRATAQGLGGPRSAAGYDGVRDWTRELDRSLRSFEVVARATQGTRPGDLHRLVGNSGATTAQLAADPRALAEIVTNIKTVTGALAAHDTELAQSITELDRVVRVAPGTLRSLDRALPVATRFANALRPTLRKAPAALRASSRTLDQVAGLVAAPELPRLLNRIGPINASFPTLAGRLQELLPLVTGIGRCTAETIVPTLNQKIPDGPLTTGDPAWLDLMHMGTNAIGAGPSTDGNGTTIRVGVAGGEQSLQGFLPGVGNVVASGDIEGVRPTWLGPGVELPWRPDAPCEDQAIADLSKRSGGPPAWLRPGPKITPNAGDQRLLETLFSDGPLALRRLLLRRLPARQQRPALRRPKRPTPAAKPIPVVPQAKLPIRPDVPRSLPDLGRVVPNDAVQTLLDGLRPKLGGR